MEIISVLITNQFSPLDKDHKIKYCPHYILQHWQQIWYLKKEGKKGKNSERGQILVFKTWWLCTHFCKWILFPPCTLYFHHGHCFIKPIYNHEIQRMTINIAMYNFHGFTQYSKTKSSQCSFVQHKFYKLLRQMLHLHA